MLTVVEDIDVFEEARSCLNAAVIALAMHRLFLQRGREAVAGSVVMQLPVRLMFGVIDQS
jgi:hypothetical protein